MAVTEGVLYRLGLGGSLESDADANARAIKGLGKAAKETEDDVDDLGEKMDKTGKVGEKVGSLLGGAWGDLADVVIDLGEKVGNLSSSVGGMGGAAIAAGGSVAILTAAIAVGAGATKELLDHAVETKAALEKLGYVLDDTDGVTRWARSSDDLSVSLQKLEVAFAEEVGPAAASVADHLSDALDTVRDLVKYSEGWADTLREPLFFLTQGGSEFIGRRAFNNATAEGAPRELAPWQYPGQADYRTDATPTKAELEYDAEQAELIGAWQNAKAQAAAKAAAERAKEQAKLVAEQFAADAAMRKYAISTPDQLAGSIGFLGATTQNPWATGSLGAGLSYNPMLSNSGDLSDLAGLASPMMELSAALATNTDAVVADTKVTLDSTSSAALAGAIGGGSVGSIVGAAGGPYGAVIGALLDQISGGTLVDTVSGLTDSVMAIYTDLPDIVGELLSDFVPELIRSAPEMAAAWSFLAPAVAVQIAASLDDIALAIIDAILGLPAAFAREIADLIPGGNGNGFLGLGKLFGGGRDEQSVDLRERDRQLFGRLRRQQGSYGNNESLEPLT